MAHGRCQSCGYRLDGLRDHVCPECGQPFDPDDSMTFSRGLDNPVRVCVLDSTEAGAARHELEDAGIPTVISDVIGGIIGHTDINRSEVWVERDDQSRAETVLREAQARIRAAANTEPWTCPKCGEFMTAAFELCWNCQTQRPTE